MLKITDPKKLELLGIIDADETDDILLSHTIIGKFVENASAIVFSDIYDLNNPKIIAKAYIKDIPGKISCMTFSDRYLYVAMKDYGIASYDLNFFEIKFSGIRDKYTSVPIKIIGISEDQVYPSEQYKTDFKIFVSRFPWLTMMFNNERPRLFAGIIATLLLAFLGVVLPIVNKQAKKDQRRKRELEEAEQHLLSMPAYSLAHISEDEMKRGDPIGSGASGNVFKGLLLPNTLIAIKELKGIKVTSSLINSMTPEIEIISTLNNVNIVRIYGISLDSGSLCLIMEYMNKGSLTSYLAQKHLSEGERTDIALQIAMGLLHLHKQKTPIIHGDIKSQNILLHEEDNALHAKLTDFGLSTIKPKHVGMSGTIAWMAPELMSGKQSVTKESDVYSFGMLLWELVTQKIPFEDSSPSLIKEWVLNQHVRETIPESCSTEFKSLIEKCWAIDPRQRPTMNEVVTQLKQYKNTLTKNQTPQIELSIFAANKKTISPGSSQQTQSNQASLSRFKGGK